MSFGLISWAPCEKSFTPKIWQRHLQCGCPYEGNLLSELKTRPQERNGESSLRESRRVEVWNWGPHQKSGVWSCWIVPGLKSHDCLSRPNVALTQFLFYPTQSPCLNLGLRICSPQVFPLRMTITLSAMHQSTPCLKSILYPCQYRHTVSERKQKKVVFV